MVVKNTSTTSTGQGHCHDFCKAPAVLPNAAFCTISSCINTEKNVLDYENNFDLAES